MSMLVLKGKDRFQEGGARGERIIHVFTSQDIPGHFCIGVESHLRWLPREEMEHLAEWLVSELDKPRPKAN